MAKQYNRSEAAKKGWRRRRYNKFVEELAREEYTEDTAHYEYEDITRYFNYSEGEDVAIENPEMYADDKEDLMTLGESIDSSLITMISTAIDYTRTAQRVMEELEKIRTALGKQYYLNLADNWSEIQGHTNNIIVESNSENVEKSYIKIIGFAVGDHYSTTAFEADLHEAIKIDARMRYRKHHPNAQPRILP